MKIYSANINQNQETKGELIDDLYFVDKAVMKQIEYNQKNNVPFIAETSLTEEYYGYSSDHQYRFLGLFYEGTISDWMKEQVQLYRESVLSTIVENL